VTIKQLVAGEATITEETETNKSLRFIGAMLSVESHHEKALKVFQAYLLKSAEKGLTNKMNTASAQKVQVQQQLILATLADLAKNYTTVIASLKELDSYILGKNIATESFVKASLMKAKAFRKENRISEAVEILLPIVEKHDASDSIQLELVRLLIMDKRKSEAFVYLKVLTTKHPDNNDLLKSLIALEIDQSQYQAATRDIQKLKQYKAYASDAKYFMAEVLEAQGDSQSALEKYAQVTEGALLKNAKKKILSLTRRMALDTNKQAESSSVKQRVNFKKEFSH
jgi:tetratricopeptide (TPR) repeat protein